MDQLSSVLIEIVIPIMVTTVLGIAVPATLEWRKRNATGRTALFIEILDKAIASGIAYFKDTKVVEEGTASYTIKPTPDKVLDYVKKSIPETLARENVTDQQLLKKVAAKLQQDALDMALQKAIGK